MKKVLLILLAISLTSCGLIKNRDSAYMSARPAPILKMPANANEAKLGNDYTITGSKYPTSNIPVSKVPPKNT